MRLFSVARSRCWLVCLVGLMLSGCASFWPTAQEPPPQVASPIKPVRLALALGGGAARGFAHIGVIKVLEAQGIRPDMVVGTSAGAVVGALYAGGHDAQSLEKIAQQMDEKVFADWTWDARGFLKGEALENFVNQHLKQRRMESLNKPFAAVATDLNTGKAVVFRTGDTGMAVRASAAVPGIFLPAQFRGQTYVDGGLVSPVPVRAAREMGADIVIAVDISAQPEGQPVDSLPKVLWQTLTIMGGVISQNELEGADIVIRPHLPYVQSWDFKARNQALREGEKAALAAIPLIRQGLENKSK